MINLDFTTLIDLPVKDVFAYVANPNNMSKWNSAVASIQQVTPGRSVLAQNSKQLGKCWDVGWKAKCR